MAVVVAVWWLWRRVTWSETPTAPLFASIERMPVPCAATETSETAPASEDRTATSSRMEPPLLIECLATTVYSPPRATSTSANHAAPPWSPLYEHSCTPTATTSYCAPPPPPPIAAPPLALPAGGLPTQPPRPARSGTLLPTFHVPVQILRSRVGPPPPGGAMAVGVECHASSDRAPWPPRSSGGDAPPPPRTPDHHPTIGRAIGRARRASLRTAPCERKRSAAAIP